MRANHVSDVTLLKRTGLRVHRASTRRQACSDGPNLASCGVFPAAFNDRRERGYAFLSALAMLDSAASRVLRDVAMFIRIWPAPPVPYEAPCVMWTFAFRTRKRSTIVSGVTGRPSALVAAAASLSAPILSTTALTSSHERYVPSARVTLINGMFARTYDSTNWWLPSMYATH